MRWSLLNNKLMRCVFCGSFIHFQFAFWQPFAKKKKTTHSWQNPFYCSFHVIRCKLELSLLQKVQTLMCLSVFQTWETSDLSSLWGVNEWREEMMKAREVEIWSWTAAATCLTALLLLSAMKCHSSLPFLSGTSSHLSPALWTTVINHLASPASSVARSELSSVTGTSTSVYFF